MLWQEGGVRMSATDELRRMLDERGVEYKTKDRPSADHADWEAWMHGDGHQPSGAVRRETLWGQPTDVASGKSIPHVYHYRATEMGDRLFLEAQLVTPEQAIAATVGDGDYTTALATEFVRVLEERDTLNAKLEVSQSMRHAEYERYTEENAKLQKQGARLFDKTLELADENTKLRERITTQKQTVQAYRDESREWREVAERAQAENAKLRKLVRWLYEFAYSEYPDRAEELFADELRELGIEVDE